tara:strand:+ start:5485 stop:8256 length:2772 start_codon:yes stop_codon:yes gene_type:complete
MIQGLVHAQNFGGHPPSVKWLQIDTDNVRIIFPAGQDKEASRIARLINYIHNGQLQSIGSKTKKIDLVLQTNQVQSNGYVALIPYRSEFFATPFQNNHALGSINFLDGLAIHEYRHALQYSNANRGATKFFHLFSGQPGWTGAMNLSIPNWYFEGDAVISETVLSSSGRGRTPEFFKEQRALLFNDVDYSYMKARNGSYKDLVPNHYPLGYAIMNYGRNHFGANIWKDVLADAGAYETIIYPFSGAMKRHTGMRAPEMYKKTYTELKQQWSSELDDLELTSHNIITPKNLKTVTNNQYAHFLEDGSLVYLSSSYKKTPAIFQLKDGKVSRLTSIGVSTSSFISENNGKLAWTELETDPRWSNRNYTKLVTFDLNTLEKNILLNKTKFFSPQFSNNGSKIVAVHSGNDLIHRVTILNSESGTIIETLPNPNNDFLSYPKWSTNDSFIIYLAKRNSELALFKFHLENNELTQLTDWTHNVIGNISVGAETVIFSASYTGIDNIFSVDLNDSRQITQLTSSRIGAYQPDISSDGKTLIMSEFTEQGYVLSSLSLSNAIDTVIAPKEPTEMARFNLTLSENEEDILGKIPEENFEVKNYQGVLDGTKLHTWGIQSGTNITGLSLGFSNILNNLNGNIFGGINHNERTYQMSGNLEYSKYFTVISLGTTITERSFVFYDPQISATTFLLDEFNQRSFNAGLSIPLSWQRGNYSTSLSVRSDLVQYWTDDTSLDGPLSWEPSLFVYNIRRQAYQNVQPRFGQYLSMNYSTTLNGSNGERFNTQAGIFLPGVFANHGILVEGEYQKELLTNRYQYADFFNYARGYGYFSSEEVSRLSLNYKLPLFYPDWGFFNFAYFKRIRANFFYDVAESRFSFTTNSITQKSYGIELSMDNVMLNVLPMSFVFRQSFLPDAFTGNPSSNFEFFVQVSL